MPIRIESRFALKGRRRSLIMRLIDCLKRSLLSILEPLKKIANHGDINTKLAHERPAERTSIPEFYAIYASRNETDTQEFERRVKMNVAASGVGVVFGGIHCVGWALHFPSLSERSLWRACALFVTGAPCFVGLFYLMYWLLLHNFSHRQPYITPRRTDRVLSVFIGLQRRIFKAIALILLLYIVARICLLVQALICLGNLPSGAYVVVAWSLLVPHI